MKSAPVLLLALISTLFAMQCTSPPPKEAPQASQPEPPDEVTLIDSPAGSDSTEPNLSTGPDGRVYLTWLETAGDKTTMKFSTLLDGHVWSPAVTIAEGTQWFLDPADTPSLVALPNGILAAHWLAGHKAGTTAYNVYISFSHDRGKTWSTPIVPHRDRSANPHGFVSLVETPNNQLAAFWLDGGKLKNNTGNMALALTTIDADGKLGKETVLDDRVSECSQTSATPTPDGILAVYRDRSDTDIRDIAMTQLTANGWSKPQLLAGGDSWKIDSCPSNGPAVARSGNNVSIAWFANAHNISEVNVALSFDLGKTFGKLLRVDDGMPEGRVGVTVLPAGDTVVSWVENTGTRLLACLRLIKNGGVFVKDLYLPSARSSVGPMTVPRVTGSGDLVVVAWTDQEKPSKVHTATVKFQ